MDPNANALGAPTAPVAPASVPTNNTPAAPTAPAPEGQLVNPPAAGTVETPTPGTEGGLQLDAETQKYLEAQNIKLDNPTAAIAELAKRHQELRARKPESAPKADNMEVLDVLNGKPETPATPPAQPEKPATPPIQAGPKGPSEMEIVTASMAVNSQYKDVTVDADFYREMKADGFQPVSSDGSLKLQNILNYAKYKQTLFDAQKAKEQYQANPASIPEPTNKIETADVELVQTMDELAASNIVIFSNRQQKMGQPVHPQLEEAKTFLQKSV